MNNPPSAGNAEGAKSLTAVPHDTLRGTVSGLVRIDVTGLTGRELERAVLSLSNVPAGASVELVVAPGQHYPAAVETVRRESVAHVIVVCSDPVTLHRWVLALREGLTWLN